ncbi:MAG: MBL fold metallo-hydrolase [Chlamydiota bacterium]
MITRCSVVFFSSALLIFSAAVDPGYSQSLDIYCIEVGLDDAPPDTNAQGDSTLILSPDGSTRVLIDGGMGKENGADSVLACLSRVIPTGGLTAMIATHWDADHYQGLSDIADNVATGMQYMPTTIYDLGDIGSDPSWTYKTTFEGRRVTPTVGTTLDLGGGCSIRFVTINGNILGGGFKDPVVNGEDVSNARSIGVVVRYGGFDYLTCGDLEGVDLSDPYYYVNTEGPLGAALAAEGTHIDVLHANHHGSSLSTISAFVSAIGPEYAVISCGDGNTYEHPTQSVINRLSGLSQIYLLEQGTPRTGSNITIVGNGNMPGYPGDPTEQGSLHISVSDGGRRFTFSNEGPNTNGFIDGPYDSSELTRVNFQPAASSTPSGYYKDSGAAYSSHAGPNGALSYGWR